MRCVKCGHENPDDANFCRNCGSPTLKNKTYLIQRARENDQTALAEIYRISSPAVYKTIRVLIKDEDTVYDLLQDTYVKAFTRLDQLQNPDRLVPWLKMIANNLAKDWLKKSKPVFFTDMSGEEDLEDISFEESIEDTRTELNPEIAMDEKEVQRLISEILDQLPEEQRMIIGMFYYEEMSVKDISRTLGVSENTVKSRLSYGRKKVKEQVLELEKRGTKLYSLAPFAFFLYLLGRADKVSAEPLVQKALPDIMRAYFREISGNAAQQVSYGRNLGDNEIDSGNRTFGSGNGNATEPGNPGRGEGQHAGRSRGSGPIGAGAAATGTTAKYAGLKIAAVILAGALGAGGVTYGVVRNADKLPFVNEQKQSAETQKKAAATATEEIPEAEESSTEKEPPIEETPIAEKTPAAVAPSPTPTLTPTPTLEIPQEETTGITEYYSTTLNHKTGGFEEASGYYIPGTTQVEYDADQDTLTFYASFAKANEIPIPFDKEENFLEYGQRTFQLTADTKYYGNEQDDYVPWTKESAIDMCVRVGYLGVVLKVTDGKVETITFYS